MILYVIVILSACYSVIDSAFTATSSVFVVDIIKPLAPHITERSLYAWAKAPMFLAAAIAAAVVLTGVDFVTIVLTSYAICTAILIPLALSLFWSRMTGPALSPEPFSRSQSACRSGQPPATSGVLFLSSRSALPFPSRSA